MFWPVPQSSLLMQLLQAASPGCSPVTAVVSSAVGTRLLCVTGGHLTSSSSQNCFKHNRYCIVLDCVKHWTLHVKN